MIKCTLADFNVAFNAKFDYLRRQCENYFADFDKPDIAIDISDAMLASERENADGNCSDGYIESICAYRALSERLPKMGAFLMHASVIDVNSRGVAFLAESGTGKTTHTLLWKRLLGDRVTVINGDKPLVRRLSDGFYAYGTPWSGKEGLQTNAKTRLSDLCIIVRSRTNRVEKCPPGEAVSALMRQVYMPSSADELDATLMLADGLLKQCRVWRIYCNTDISAAEAAFNTVFGDVSE